MSGVCRLTYHEKTFTTEPGRHCAVRYYENAESNVKFKDGGHSPSLARNDAWWEWPLMPQS